jgi:hypothetical protein
MPVVLTCVPFPARAGTALLLATTIIIGIILVLLLIIVLIVLILLLGKRIRLRNLSQIGKLGFFSGDDPLFNQFFKFCYENVLFWRTRISTVVFVDGYGVKNFTNVRTFMTSASSYACEFGRLYVCAL